MFHPAILSQVLRNTSRHMTGQDSDQTSVLIYADICMNRRFCCTRFSIPIPTCWVVETIMVCTQGGVVWIFSHLLFSSLNFDFVRVQWNKDLKCISSSTEVWLMDRPSMKEFGSFLQGSPHAWVSPPKKKLRGPVDYRPLIDNRLPTLQTKACQIWASC